MERRTLYAIFAGTAVAIAVILVLGIFPSYPASTGGACPASNGLPVSVQGHDYCHELTTVNSMQALHSTNNDTWTKTSEMVQFVSFTFHLARGTSVETAMERLFP